MAALTEVRANRPRTGSPAERFTSRDWTQFPEPQGKDETWRFTPLARIRTLLDPFTPAQLIVDDVSVPEWASWSIVSSEHSSVGRVLAPTDRASALAWDNESNAVVIEIEAGQALQDPVVVTYRGEPALTCSHTVVRAAAGCQATVIVEYLGSSTLSENVEIIVEDDAQLTFVTVRNWTDDSIHLATHTCSLGERSTLKHVVVDLGGSLLRTTPSVRLNGPHSSVEMLGVGVAGANQHMEAHLYVDHGAPECTSNVLYKNVLLAPTARTVWIGDVRIRPEATQTTTYEMNRNLLLRTGARADSVPNLEIETGDVAEAGHASATGRFDDEELFYLESRGIARDQAQQLVVRGFLADVVSRIDLQPIREHIMNAIDSRLSNVQIPIESTSNPS